MLDVEALSEMMAGIIAEEVDKAVTPLTARIAELEARKPEQGPPGEKGEPGERGTDGHPGADGVDGKDGNDGRGVKDLLIDRDGQLIATMDDGEMKSLGLICGKDGKDGMAGRDGIDLTSFDAVVLGDDRTIELKFASGDEERVASFKWPTAIYRNVFKEGQQYEPGDMTTWGGSLWHCDKETTQKPGTEDWTLACKKGRDGKDAKNG